MSIDIEGLKLVITGGASGMGAATAKLAAGYGASVVIADLNEEKSRAVVDEIRSNSGRAWYKQCDITIDDNLSDLMEFAADSMGGIDVLHNNAGVVDAMFGTAEELTLENYSREIWDKVIAVNLTAPLFASKAALPFLRKSSSPSIIIAASVSSYFGNPQIIAYGSSKGGVAMLTKNLAVELAPYGIRVNCYCPGAIATEMTVSYCNNAPDPALAEKLLTNYHLIPRLGKPEEVAELVCFLASDKATFINGVAWPIDGGSLAWRGTAGELDFQ